MGNSIMRIKTYFVNTVAEAMAQAQVELGEDALLLNTHRLMQAGKPTGYEVVIGVNGLSPTSDAGPEKASPATAQVALAPQNSVPPVQHKLSSPAQPPATTLINQAVPPLQRQPDPDPVSSELKRLRAQMNEIQELLLRSARAQMFGGRVIPELGELFARFLEAQMDPLLAKDIVDRVEAAMATDAFFMDTDGRDKNQGENEEQDSNRWKVLSPAPKRVEKFLRAELDKRIRIVPTLGVHGATMSPVTILVGPTGGGKTTTVAKLAVAASLQAPVRLLSLDRSRPGASQQLQALAVGPNIAFTMIDSLGRLPEVFMEARKGHCVLVDTAGFAAAEWSGAEALAAALDACPEVDVQLAVPAYMNTADFRRTMERYQIFHPVKLVVTKMDEAQTFGPAFSEAIRAELSLSFVTNGPRVPDDIQAASLEDLVALSQGRPRRGVQRAA